MVIKNFKQGHYNMKKSKIFLISIFIVAISFANIASAKYYVFWKASKYTGNKPTIIHNPTTKDMNYYNNSGYSSKSFNSYAKARSFFEYLSRYFDNNKSPSKQSTKKSTYSTSSKSTYSANSYDDGRKWYVIFTPDGRANAPQLLYSPDMKSTYKVFTTKKAAWNFYNSLRK